MLELSDLDNLAFIPEPNWFGMTNYSWKGFDGKKYSKDSAQVKMKMNSVNDAPFVVDSEMNGTEDPIKFSLMSFT